MWTLNEHHLLGRQLGDWLDPTASQSPRLASLPGLSYISLAYFQRCSSECEALWGNVTAQDGTRPYR